MYCQFYQGYLLAHELLLKLCAISLHAEAYHFIRVCSITLFSSLCSHSKKKGSSDNCTPDAKANWHRVKQCFIFFENLHESLILRSHRNIAGMSVKMATSSGRCSVEPPLFGPHSSQDPIKSLYPMVNEEETPLPRCWSSKDKYGFLGLSQNNLRVHYKGKLLDCSLCLCYYFDS